MGEALLMERKKNLEKCKETTMEAKSNEEMAINLKIALAAAASWHR